MAKKAIKEGGEEAAEAAGKKLAQMAGKEVLQKAVEKGTKELAQVTTEKTMKEAAIMATEKSAKELAEEVRENLARVTKEVVKETVEKAKKDIADDVAKTVTKVDGESKVGFRERMIPEEVARYNQYWVGVANKISNEAIDNQIVYIRNGGITKPGGGSYKPAKISATVDLNNGNIYFGYNGTNKFNPSRIEIDFKLQQRINYTKELADNTKSNIFANKSSFEIWSVDNCAEIYSVNNALHNGASLDNIFINTKNFKNGLYAPPCKNCQVTFKGINMPKGG